MTLVIHCFVQDVDAVVGLRFVQTGDAMACFQLVHDIGEYGAIRATIVDN